MVRGALAAVLALAGCNSVLGLDDVHGVGDDGDELAPDGGVEPDAPPTVGPPACPAEYTRLLSTSDTLYRLMPELTAWQTAATTCASHSQTAGSTTHLAVLSNDDERVALGTALAGRTVWVGFSDRVTDTMFRWVTTEPSTLGAIGTAAWAAGEPDLGGAGCVDLSNGRLADSDCTTTRSYVCECDGFADEPSNR